MTNSPPNSPPERNFSKMVQVKLFGKLGQQIDSFEMRAGSNLWVVLRKRGHAIGSACSGVGVCGACDVSLASNVSLSVTPQNDFERDTLLRNGKTPDQRLACLCRVFSDIEVSADYW